MERRIMAHLAADTIALGALLLSPCVAAAKGLGTYLSITDQVNPSFSPTGNDVAFVAQDSGTWQVWRMRVDGHGRRQVTHSPESVDFATWIPHSAHTIFYVHAAGGNERQQFFTIRDDGTSDRPLFTAEDNVSHVFGAFSPSGRQLAFSSNRRDAAVFDVYVMDVDGRHVRRVFTSRGAAYAAGWSFDGHKILVRRINSPYDDDLFLVDLANAASRHLTPHRGKANFDGAAFAADDRSVICITTLDREFRTLVRIDIAHRTISTMRRIPYDVDELRLSADGSRLAYSVNREGYGDVVIADARTAEPAMQARTPPSVPESLVFDPSGRQLVFAASGPTFPKTIWRVDLDRGTTEAVTHPDLHGIAADSLVIPALAKVRSFDGRTVPGWLYRPKSRRTAWPVVMDIHGGPEEQDRVWFWPWAQYLVSRGYALFDPNIRGSTGYGRTYLHLADGRKREGAIKDVRALRTWLVRQGADPRRIALSGASYGGYAVLSSLYHYPDDWAAGVEIYGVSDWETFLEQTASYRRANREAVYGSLRNDRAFLRRISPIHHVDRIKAPVLIFAGANDPRVPLSQSRTIAMALRKHGVPVELRVYGNEGHGIAHVSNLRDLYDLQFRFIEKYLGR
jgi:dipeptidyl aminopeptidase/acylaminoacyl peptidase